MERTGTSSPRHTRTRRISGQHVIGQAPRGRRPAHLIVVRRKEVRSPDTFAPSCTRAQSKSVVSTPLEVDAIQVSARWWPGKLDVVVRQLARVSCVASRGIFRIPERPIRAAILSSERNGEMKMALCFAFFERMTPGHGGFSAPCLGTGMRGRLEFGCMFRWPGACPEQFSPVLHVQHQTPETTLVVTEKLPTRNPAPASSTTRPSLRCNAPSAR